MVNKMTDFSKIETRLKKLQSGYKNMVKAEGMAPVEYQNELYSDFLTDCERLFFEARKTVPIVYTRNSVYRSTYLGLSDLVDIRRYKDGILIKIPRLLPHRKNNSAESKVCFYNCFLPALEAKLKTQERFHEKVVIWYKHIYSNLHEKRDYDSIETKYITDLITPYLIGDDNPSFCHVYQTSEKGQEAMTEIRIFPVRMFADILQGKGEVYGASF